MSSKDICDSCEGDGLIDRVFFPDVTQSIRRYERLRCGPCNGMGVIDASEQAKLYSPV